MYNVLQQSKFSRHPCRRRLLGFRLNPPHLLLPTTRRLMSIFVCVRVCVVYVCVSVCVCVRVRACVLTAVLV